MNVSKVLSYAPKNSSVVGLLFSASYCKYCTVFTPTIKKVYEELKTHGVDIVLVGSDKTQDKFDEYSKDQHWPVIPFEDPIRVELRKMYDIKTIPALVFIDKEGDVVSTNGRYLVEEEVRDNENSVQSAKAIARRLRLITDDYDSEDEDF